MQVEAIEANASTSFVEAVHNVQNDRTTNWGIVCVKKKFMRPVTNEAFVQAMRTTIQGRGILNIYFCDEIIYMLWNGPQNRTFQQIHAFVHTVALPTENGQNISHFINYINPRDDSAAVATLLETEKKRQEKEASDWRKEKPIINIAETDGDDIAGEKGLVISGLSATSAQTEQFNIVCREKPYRQQRRFLIVEDQIFSQRLLCEILRGVTGKLDGGNVQIDIADGMNAAWKEYLKKAHDIVFVDLGLADGSGHTLAQAIKELDSSSYVIIVTANDYEEEVVVARQNNTDAFITKPYSKKQITDCVNKYMVKLKGTAPSRNRTGY